jgi:hypothetical protein
MPSRQQIAATVARLFAAAGEVVRPATLSRGTAGTYDPASGGPGETGVTASAAMVLFDTNARPRFGLADGLAIPPSQELLWVTGCSFAPQAGDTITIDGITRTIHDAVDLFHTGALFQVAAQ